MITTRGVRQASPGRARPSVGRCAEARPPRSIEAVRAPALLLLLLLASACTTAREPAAPQPGLRLPDAGEAAGTAPELRLSAEPVRGEVPLTVRFEAELQGEVDPDAGFDCPTLAWTLDARDDGQVVLAQAEGCRPGRVARRFQLEHRYEQARAYEVSLQLIGLDLPASNLVQVLVEGPTATPAPQVARPGPTIVIATPAATRVAARVEAEPGATRPRATATAAQPGATSGSPAAAPREPSPTPVRAARVLPADLYFLDAGHRALWRLDASGREPEAILPPGEPIGVYAVAADGRIAYSRGGRLLLGEGRSSRVVTETEASALLWTRDGQRLAYSAEDRLYLHDPRLGPDRVIDRAAVPLAWSPEGDQLLARVESGLRLLRPDAPSAEPVTLPIRDVRAAGWLPGRDTIWLAGAGLRLLSFQPGFTLTELIPSPSKVESTFHRADDRLLCLVREGESAQPTIIDLTAPEPRARPLGPALDEPELQLAWAPGGRFAALAGRPGLVLLDPLAGVQVPLLRQPASRPSWHLRLR